MQNSPSGSKDENKMRRELTKEEKEVLREMAERVVSIRPGDKLGRWTRGMRVSLVYSVLCSLVRHKSNEARK